MPDPDATEKLTALLRNLPLEQPMPTSTQMDGMRPRTPIMQIKKRNFRRRKYEEKMVRPYRD